MTAKEKAEDLFYKYLIYFPEFRNDLEYDYNTESAKTCALIAVDEILNTKSFLISIPLQDKKYWGNVKQEIIKL